MAGMAVCAIAARNLKRKVSGQKRLYQAALILTAGFLLAAVFYQVDNNKAGEKQIARGEPGQGSQEREYVIEAEGVLEEYPLKLQIEEKKLTKEQRQECLKEAKKELDQVIAGENPSKEEVSSALYLPQTLQEGAVEAEYQFSDYEVFEPDGTLKTKVIKPVTVEITAELTCQDEVCLYTFLVQAVPEEKSEQELFAEKLCTLLQQENDREGTAYVNLPEEVDGKAVTWKEQTENRSMIAVLLGIAGAVGIILREKEEEKREKTKRQDQLLLDYPEIVSKLSLLLGAGMNISTAWEKIALTYQKKRENGEIEIRYAYEEMLTVLHEIRDGVGELQAYENFGERCHLAVYRKLSSLIVQNVRKGAKGMQRLLEDEETEAFEQRKARAKKAGEEAGTKLLLPMGIMLVIVLAILVVPAGLSFGV